MVSKRTFEVRDLDETVTREEVVAVLCVALGKPDLGDQCTPCKRFSGVQTAVVRLTEADARSLLGLGRNVKFLQLDLGRGKGAQDLLMLTARESRADVLLISSDEERGVDYRPHDCRAPSSLNDRRLVRPRGNNFE